MTNVIFRPKFWDIYQPHEKSLREKIGSNWNKKIPCGYYQSIYGCRKGINCNYDHSETAQAQPMVKVPKLCKDKEACVWTPRCRYVHPENGEVLPTGVERSFRQGMQAQVFGQQDSSQQLPGWNNPPPPIIRPHLPSTSQANNLTQGEQERRSKVLMNFLQLLENYKKTKQNQS